MRTLLSVVLAVCVSVSMFAVNQVRTAEAAFHCMRIHAVMGGFNGNNNVQYVELRMDMPGQTFISGHTIQFFDSAGTPKATFTFPASPPISNSSTGESILIATSEFNSNVTGGAADFTFSGTNTVGANGGDALHPVQLPGGSVVFPGFTCGTPRSIVDSVAYGSATATFGSAAVSLPNPGTLQALRLSNLNVNPSDNSTEYSLQNVSTTTFTASNLTGDFTTPRNNGRTVLRLGPAAPSVGGIAEGPSLVGASVASATTGGGTDAGGYAIAGGIALAAIAASAGLYVYRRRAS